MSGFSFGSSVSPSSFSFTNPSYSPSPFGSSSPSTGFSFGPSSLFSFSSASASTTNPTSAASPSPSPLSFSSSTSLFSAPTTTTTTTASAASFGFGSSSSSSASTAPSFSFGFGSAPTAPASAPAPTPTPSLFGSSSAAASSASPLLPTISYATTPFGATSISSATTPFGGSSSVSTLFGATSTSTTPFGGTTPFATAQFAVSSSAATPFGGISTSSATTPFGGSSSASTTLFGGASSSAATTLFGGSSSATITTPFGGSSTSATTTTPFGFSLTSSASSSAATNTLSTFSSAFATGSSSSSSSTTPFSAAFAKPTAPTTNVSSTTATATTSSSTSGFSFGTPTPSASQPSFGFTLTPASASAPTSASSGAAISISATPAASKPSSSTSGTTSAVSTSVGAAPKLPSEITGKTVEEIIKEWNAELQERTGKFRKQANVIAEWDRRILQNCDVLLRLEIEVAKVVESQTQSNLELQLELIETHQQEVDKALQSMEEEAERIYKDERGLLLDDEAASTRDAMYEQSELIEGEMEHMTEQIKSIIQSLNSNQGGELDGLDGVTPLDAVVRILNNQLTSLMWIDEKEQAAISPASMSKQSSAGVDVVSSGSMPKQNVETNPITGPEQETSSHFETAEVSTPVMGTSTAEAQVPFVEQPTSTNLDATVEGGVPQNDQEHSTEDIQAQADFEDRVMVILNIDQPLMVSNPAEQVPGFSNQGIDLDLMDLDEDIDIEALVSTIVPGSLPVFSPPVPTSTNITPEKVAECPNPWLDLLTGGSQKASSKSAQSSSAQGDEVAIDSRGIELMRGLRILFGNDFDILLSDQALQDRLSKLIAEIGPIKNNLPIEGQVIFKAMEEFWQNISPKLEDLQRVIPAYEAATEKKSKLIDGFKKLDASRQKATSNITSVSATKASHLPYLDLLKHEVSRVEKICAQCDKVIDHQQKAVSRIDGRTSELGKEASTLVETLSTLEPKYKEVVADKEDFAAEWERIQLLPMSGKLI